MFPQAYQQNVIGDREARAACAGLRDLAYYCFFCMLWAAVMTGICFESDLMLGRCWCYRPVSLECWTDVPPAHMWLTGRA